MASCQPTPEAVASVPRPRLQAAGIAAATLWLPCLVGLGIVVGSQYALATYWKFFAVLPGLIVPVLCQLDDFLSLVLAVLTTLVAYVVLYLSVRHMPLIPLRITVAVAAALVGAEAVVIGGILRA